MSRPADTSKSEHLRKDRAHSSMCETVLTDHVLCIGIAHEEDRKLGEFARNLNKPEYLQRLRERGGLCIPHARKLLERVANALRDEIILAVQRQAVELGRELVTLSRDAKAGMTIHPGVLGRAAEYLVAKRGLDIKR